MASRRLFVGDLHDAVSEAELRQVFKQCGSPSVTVEFPKDAEGYRKGFAYVSFPSTTSAKKCLRAPNGIFCRGQRLRIQIPREHYLDRLQREWGDNQKPQEDPTGEEYDSTVADCNGAGEGEGSTCSKRQAQEPSRYLRIRKSPGEKALVVDTMPVRVSEGGGLRSRKGGSLRGTKVVMFEGLGEGKVMGTKIEQGPPRPEVRNSDEEEELQGTLEVHQCLDSEAERRVGRKRGREENVLPGTDEGPEAPDEVQGGREAAVEVTEHDTGKQGGEGEDGEILRLLDEEAARNRRLLSEVLREVGKEKDGREVKRKRTLPPSDPSIPLLIPRYDPTAPDAAQYEVEARPGSSGRIQDSGGGPRDERKDGRGSERGQRKGSAGEEEGWKEIDGREGIRSGRTGRSVGTKMDRGGVTTVGESQKKPGGKGLDDERVKGQIAHPSAGSVNGELGKGRGKLIDGRNGAHEGQHEDLTPGEQIDADGDMEIEERAIKKEGRELMDRQRKRREKKGKKKLKEDRAQGRMDEVVEEEGRGDPGKAEKEPVPRAQADLEALAGIYRQFRSDEGQAPVPIGMNDNVSFSFGFDGGEEGQGDKRERQREGRESGESEKVSRGLDMQGQREAHRGLIRREEDASGEAAEADELEQESEEFKIWWPTREEMLKGAEEFYTWVDREMQKGKGNSDRARKDRRQLRLSLKRRRKEAIKGRQVRVKLLGVKNRKR